MRKLYYLISFIVGLFIIYLFFAFNPKSYEYEYSLNEISVKESFNKTTGVYSLAFNETYTFAFKQKYSRNRGLVIKANLADNCVTFSTEKIERLEICKSETGQYMSYYDDEVSTKKTEAKDNINIYSIKDSNIYFWDYTHFVNINIDGISEIELFKNDIYQLDVISKMNDYLVVADYDQKYTYDRLYLINTKNNDMKESKLEYDIYFNSYILGNYKKELYIYDVQMEKQYKALVFKNETERTGYKIYVNNKWESVTTNKLNKKELFFKNDADTTFGVQNNKLYYQLAGCTILVSNIKVDRLVDIFGTEAYFLSGDTLYRVNIYDGVSKVLSYKEWEYNNKNIYIFQ